MIAAEHLRRGNWLQDGLFYMGYFQVKEIYEDNVKSSDFIIPYSDLKGIELTEEILIKCGFQIAAGGISYDKDKLSIYFGDTILSGPNGRTYFNSWAILEHTPKYLHELQNLYFCLVGKELEIEL